MVNKSMTIGEVLDKLGPEAPAVFAGYGMFCVGCPSAQGESVEAACEVHGVDADELINALNQLNSAQK